MMYPMKGLSCTGAMCPLATPLARGISGLQGSTMLGPPLGMNADLLVRLSPPTEPLAVGVRSNERRTGGNGETSPQISCTYFQTLKTNKRLEVYLWHISFRCTCEFGRAQGHGRAWYWDFKCTQEAVNREPHLLVVQGKGLKHKYILS